VINMKKIFYQQDNESVTDYQKRLQKALEYQKLLVKSLEHNIVEINEELRQIEDYWRATL